MTIGVRRLLANVPATIGMIAASGLSMPTIRARVGDTVVPNPGAAAPARPPQTPRVLVPPSLDRQLGQVKVFLGRDLEDSYSFVMLAEEARVPMGIEQWPRNQNPRVVPRGLPPPALLLGPGKLSDALYTLLDRQPLYELSILDGALAVGPTALVQMPGHFLDVPLDRFSVNRAAIGQAVRVLRHLMNPAFPDRGRSGNGFSIGGTPGEDTQARVQKAEVLFNRPVTLSIRHATPRQILNRLVAQHGELFWVAEYMQSEAAGPVETNCTISLHTFADVRISRSY